MRQNGWTSRIALRAVFFVAALALILQLSRASAAEAQTTWKAGQIRRRSSARHGILRAVRPSENEMLHTDGTPAGRVMLYFPERTGEELTVRLPLRSAGYYRVVGTHVYGAWRPRRYGLYTVLANGIPLPGRFHGWYHAGGPPEHWPEARAHLRKMDWGVVHLQPPAVELTFRPALDGLLGIERLSLQPVQEDDLSAEERQRRAPGLPGRSGQKSPEPTFCTVEKAGPLRWVVPARRQPVRVDGELTEWDLSRHPIIADKTTMRNLGWQSPAPEGDADLSMRAALAWDEENLYVVARVRDDQLVETTDRRRPAWTRYDGLVLRTHLPAWLSAGPGAGKTLHFGFNYYSPTSDEPPREGRSDWHYVARPAKDGYVIEAAVPFSRLGFRPAAGSRLPFLFILVDHDPDKPRERQFAQYGLPTRGHGPRQVGQMRLIGQEGWGADLMPADDSVAPGNTVSFHGTVDVWDASVHLGGVRLVNPANGAVLARQACPRTPAAGHRYRIRGALRIPEDARGRYDLELYTADSP